ncbi:class I SAM-dependent methyltransferase [Desulfothermobacter acidiphilus]|uniref:class I SAM-dependent methyltransferase n=1 Tax=Desulfothermobacter acidiphilus TaxID=1938353 RepID=UPI003F8A43FB
MATRAWNGDEYDVVSQQRFAVGDLLIRLAAVRSGEDVLDVGCGTGELTLKLAKIAYPGRVLGIDNAPEMIGVALSKAKATGVQNLEFRVQDMRDLDLVDEFDVVFSNSALQWVWEQETVLTALFRALRPGGRLALQFTAKDFSPPLLRALEAVATMMIPGCPCRSGKYPWFMGEEESYRRLVKTVGFSEAKVWREKWTLYFPAAEAAVAFFRAAGLQPYLALLPEASHAAFCMRLAEELEAICGCGEIELPFDRLFVLGQK